MRHGLSFVSGWLMALVLGAQAQMPHEVLLLVNKNSPDSIYVANAWAGVRGVPGKNVVMLEIPEAAFGGRATVTPDEFTKLIWEPAMAVAEEREIAGHILAWVYSVDFPIRVATDAYDRKQMSVLGLTFLRNKLPDLQVVEEGTYLSKLFGGPNDRFKASLPGLSFGLQRRGLGAGATVPAEATYLERGLGNQMPLPSMMLGYTGEKGNTVEEVIASIRNGRTADHFGRGDGFYLIEGEDVRAKTRQWQFEAVKRVFDNRKIGCTITNSLPAGAEQVMGLMMGAETVDPSLIKSFAPGALADHLTSWAGEFQRPQTKLTEWIRAGASGSAGTVVEPYSNPAKFPSARLFEFYISGCSMMESYYQSIASPLQSLLIGDPLARPYAPPISVSILGADTLTRNFTYIAQPKSKMDQVEFRYHFLIDGALVREHSEDPSYYVNIERLSDGYHELRAVASIKHLVEFYGQADKGFVVDRLGRSVTIRKKLEAVAEGQHGVTVDIGGYEMPVRLKLLAGERVLDESLFSEEAMLTLDEKRLGEGPNRIRVVAVYEDGMEVSSHPVGLSIEFKK
jgi:hypothetical protein